MRIVIAPDSFKGSLSAAEAAEAMRRGAYRACAHADIDVCPLSDGGEGFLRVVTTISGGTVRVTRVTGPVGDPVDAVWAVLNDGTTAVIESAEAVGLGRVEEERRAPTRTTTFGVGQLIRVALEAGARVIVVGLGGTATTDGGVGMAQALGVVFDGVTVPALGGELGALRRIDVSARVRALDGVELVALSDVDNPLTGAEGAARVFGPQKGANDIECGDLDAALAHLARIAGDAGVAPGDGAAGGLGYGLRVFAGARVQSGIEYVIGASQLDAKLKNCSLVLTGEGRIDAQSARGKVVSGVVRRCKAARVPVVALVGAIGSGAEALHEEGLTAYFSLCDRPMPAREAKERAAILLEALAHNVVRLKMAE